MKNFPKKIYKEAVRAAAFYGVLVHDSRVREGSYVVRQSKTAPKVTEVAVNPADVPAKKCKPLTWSSGQQAGK